MAVRIKVPERLSTQILVTYEIKFSMAMLVQGPRCTRKHNNLLLISVHCFNRRFLVVKRLLSLHQKYS